MGQQFLLAWRSIWRQRRRTLITALSIAFGLFFVITIYYTLSCFLYP